MNVDRSIESSSSVAQPPDRGNHIPLSKVEPTLVPEQQQVVDLILEGHNVFYTGSAGCGKSTILKAFVGQLKARGRKVTILAPTNLAALNVDGQTTWNFAGWTPDSMKKPLKKLKENAFGNKVHERLTDVDVVVIDEISMIENLQFERLNEVMKYARDHTNSGKGAFGGAQIVVTGDVSTARHQHTSRANLSSSFNCRQ
jgi:ATP-dependent DNA helicase PIF1